MRHAKEGLGVIFSKYKFAIQRPQQSVVSFAEFLINN